MKLASFALQKADDTGKPHWPTANDLRKFSNLMTQLANSTPSSLLDYARRAGVLAHSDNRYEIESETLWHYLLAKGITQGDDRCTARYFAIQHDNQWPVMRMAAELEAEKGAKSLDEYITQISSFQTPLWSWLSRLIWLVVADSLTAIPGPMTQERGVSKWAGDAFQQLADLIPLSPELGTTIAHIREKLRLPPETKSHEPSSTSDAPPTLPDNAKKLSRIPNPISLVGRLGRSFSETERIAAARALGEMGDDVAYKALAKALGDGKNPLPVRLAASQVLARPRFLSRLLRDPNRWLDPRSREVLRPSLSAPICSLALRHHFWIIDSQHDDWWTVWFDDGRKMRDRDAADWLAMEEARSLPD